MESSSIETKSQESYVSNQKQFCKKGVLRKFCKIHRKTPASESSENSKNIFSYRTPLVAVSDQDTLINLIWEHKS